MTPMGVNKVVNKGNGSESLQKEEAERQKLRRVTDDLAKAEEAEALARSRRIQAAKTKAVREERVEKIAEISKGNAEIEGSERFPVIYADPPWRYDYSATESRAIENQYPTLTAPRPSGRGAVKASPPPERQASGPWLTRALAPWSSACRSSPAACRRCSDARPCAHQGPA